MTSSGYRVPVKMLLVGKTLYFNTP
jgi:hypothetical protein